MESLLTRFARTYRVGVMNRCLSCKLEISEKATFCSDKCRMAYTRRTKKGQEPEQKQPEQPTRTFDFKPTRTDSLFEAKRPGYYTFSAKELSRTCVLPDCKKPFKTRLSLLKYCSPAHMDEGLDRITRTGTVLAPK